MKEVIVKVFNESKNNIPSYSKNGDAGMDIRSSEAIVVKAGKRELVKTGIYIELPIGFEMQVRGRSGLAFKHGIQILNAPGTIDSNYRGEIGIILHNTSNKDFVVNIGDRIAQLVLKEQPVCIFKEVNTHDALEKSNRGKDGYGSTGINELVEGEDNTIISYNVDKSNTKSEFERLLEEFDNLPKDIMIGKTVFEETDKAWIVTSYYTAIFDYCDNNDDLENIDELLDEIFCKQSRGVGYGSTIFEAINNWHKNNEELTNNN